jgi:anti-sigma factor RsiW
MNDADFILLSAYLDDALSEAERRALEARLHAEPGLQTALDQLRATQAVLRAAPQLAPPRDFRLTPAQARRPIRFSPPRYSMLGALAAMLIVVIGAVYLLQIQYGSMRPAAVSGAASGIALMPTTAYTADKTSEKIENTIPPATFPAAPSTSETPGIAAFSGLAEGSETPVQKLPQPTDANAPTGDGVSVTVIAAAPSTTTPAQTQLPPATNAQARNMVTETPLRYDEQTVTPAALETARQNDSAPTLAMDTFLVPETATLAPRPLPQPTQFYNSQPAPAVTPAPPAGVGGNSQPPGAGGADPPTNMDGSEFVSPPVLPPTPTAMPAPTLTKGGTVVAQAAESGTITTIQTLVMLLINWLIALLTRR